MIVLVIGNCVREGLLTFRLTMCYQFQNINEKQE